MTSIVTFDPFAGGELLRVSPTTWPQKEILASAQMSDEANTAFNEAVSITIEGELDRDLLELCFNRLVERHDILRATFSRKGNEICLHPARPFKLEYEDIRHLDTQSQNIEVHNLWRNIAISPMNLEEGPLFFAWTKRLTDSSFELIIAAHHIICDGWSIGLLLKELTELYRDRGIGDGLPPAESFFEYAEQSDAQEIANVDIDYWREKFKQIPPVLDLPIDKVRPGARTFPASRLDFELDKDLAAQLPKAAAKMKASLVNVVMAGYFALLYRLTSTSDIVVGLPVAGQAALNRVNQVGHMVQLLPIRLTINGEASFEKLVSQVKGGVLDASEHPRFTFGKLLEKMVVDRSRVPLICTIFNIDQPMNTLDFGQARGTLRTVPRAAENFEVFLNIVPAANRLTIEATYSTVLFSEETMVAWMQSLENILAEVVAGSEIKISDFTLTKTIPDVLRQSNATTTECLFPDFLSAFRAQVEKTPEAASVICADTMYSYQQLDRLSDNFAGFLAEKGIGDGNVVGICCRRSEKMVAAVLALFKVGAAYLPLDPDFPQDRLMYMLEDSAAVAVIEDNSAPKGVVEARVQHFDLDGLTEARSITPLPLPVENPARLAYLIYTSGSTGKPKGVRVHHRAMINFLESMGREPGCGPEDRLLAVTTLSFDISVLELYLPLICGATTVVADRDQVKDGEKIAELLDTHGITMLQATPSTWRMLLASSWRDRQTGHQKLKALCGGEPLPPDLVVDLLASVSELWNMFGPTETTVWSTCKRIRPSDSMITVGKPIANTQVYILDHNLKPLPLSTPGELFIGGDGVTSGYHNREELTAERFLVHPEFGRIYRTGDLAKILPNGEIQHMGRLDDQVKLRGYRIELGEIESALVACKGVRAAAAYLWQLSPEDVRIVACCVPVSADSFQTIELRKQLRDMLPSYMVPQYLLVVDEIPLMPNGKINRRGLPKPELSDSTLLTKSMLASDHEKLIAQIWTELIKPRNPIAREDNFFEIGGHSLLALEAIRKIEGVTGKRLTTREIVTETLATLAEKISASLLIDNEKISGPSALSGAAVRGLSPEQRRLLKRQLEYPESLSNNLPAGWILEGELDVPLFSKSLVRVFERQTALRTVFQLHNGEYRQILRHVNEIILPEFEDCSTAEVPMDQALEKAYHIAMQPFRPLNNQLCRCLLCKLASDKYLFMIVSHQLVFDGWSFDVFLGELEATYKAFSENRSPSATLLAFEFRDYAQWCDSRDINHVHLNYHLHALEEMPKAAFIKESHHKGACQRQVYRFSGAHLNQVEKFCGNNKLRAHEFFFTVFAKTLAEYLKESKILLGMPVTGRYSPDVIGLIGCFVSVLPCEVNIRGSHFVEIAKNIAQQLREFHEHQDMSYAEIIRGTSLEQQIFPAIMPASFSFQDIRNRPTSLAELKLSQVDMPRQQTELPIEFWIRIQSNGFLAVFDYDDALVEKHVVEALGERIAQLFDHIEELAVKPDVMESAIDVQPAPKKPLWRRLFQ